MISLAAAALSGTVVALLLTVFGGGGSVLATPLLIFFVGMRDPHLAIGTSAAAVAVNAAMGLATQARAGRVKWPCALVFSAAGLAGSLIGAALAKKMDGAQLLVWFAAAMAMIGLSMLRGARSAGDPDVHLGPALVLRLAPAGLITGFAAGFFGIGGGLLIVPGLMAASGMTLAHAAATSLVSVTLFAAATSGSYAASHLVDWTVFAAMVAGGSLGVVMGVPVARRLAQHAAIARRVFAMLILATSAYVGYRALNGL